MGDDAVTYSYRQREGELIRIEANDTEIRFRNSEKGDTRLAWDDVKRIRLATPAEGVFVTEVTPKRGKPLLIANRSVQGVVTIKPQNREYHDFILRLHRLVEKQSHIELRGGHAGHYVFITLLVYTCLLVFLAFLCVLGYAVATNTLDKLAVPSMPLASGGIALPVLIRWRKHNAPRPYRADRVPRDLLPDPRD